MSEVKHTAVEWTVRHTPMRGVSNDTWCIDWSKDQEEVAEIIHGKANAILLSEAKNMLAALRRAVLALAFATERSPAMHDDYKAVSNAIERATRNEP